MTSTLQASESSGGPEASGTVPPQLQEARGPRDPSGDNDGRPSTCNLVSTARPFRGWVAAVRETRRPGTYVDKYIHIYIYVLIDVVD